MVKFYLANDGIHKLVAEFDNPYQLVKFGSYDYNDYTIYYQIDPKLARQKKAAYLKRHRKNEDWEDPRTAGSLSKHILWGPTPSIEENIKRFIKKFNLY